MISYIASIKSNEQLKFALESKANEVLVHINGISREGGFETIDKALDLIQEVQSSIKIIIAADRILEEKKFKSYIEKIIHLNFELRVQDIGVASYLAENKIPFQLLMDTGNANEYGILEWEKSFSPYLKRIILNNEIPKEQLFSILEKVNTPCELLAFGPILIYYSKRNLLTHSGAPQEILAESEEAGPGKFQFIESEAGTVMYYHKELCLLDYEKELANAGLKFFRLDLRHLNASLFKILNNALQTQNFEELKKSWPKALLHGYYGKNKSDSVFKHLPKKQINQNRLLLAEIIDQSESEFLIKALNNIDLNKNLWAIDTKKREISWLPQVYKNNSGDALEKIDNEDLIRIPKTHKFHTGTLIYRETLED